MTDRQPQAPPSKVARNPIAATAIAAIILATLTIAVNQQSARANSATWDESLYAFLGRQALVHADVGAFAALGVAPLPVRAVWTRSVLDPVALEHNDPSVFRARLDRARRMAILVVAVPLVILALLMVAARYGLLAGITSAATIALSPTVIAHSSIATTDAPFSLVCLLCVAVLIGYTEQPTWPRAIALALVLGTSLATKYSGLGLFAAAIVVLGLRRRGHGWQRDVLLLAGGVTIGWGWHGFAVQPLLVSGGAVSTLLQSTFGPAIADRVAQLPAPILLRGIAAQAYLDRQGQEAFLLGRVSQHGWWYFFPVAVAMKATLVELLAIGGFFAAALRRRWAVDLQVPLVVVVTFFGIAMLSQRDLGIRYVLAPLVVAIVFGTAWIVEWCRERGRGRAFACATALVGMQAVTFAGISPQHLAYFNPIAGGPALGYSRLVDSNLDWGQDLIRLHDWLSRRPGTTLGLAYFGSAPLDAYDIHPIDWRSTQTPPDMFVISATYLQGIFVCGDPFAALRTAAPSERIGYTLFAYRLDREDVRAALDAAARDDCAP